MANQQSNQREGKAIADGGNGGGLHNHHLQPQRCPRCHSTNTKFCYFNNKKLSQPRFFCKYCRRYWTQGGMLRNVPVGGRVRKNKYPRVKHGASTSTPPLPPPLMNIAFGEANSSVGARNVTFNVRDGMNGGFFMSTLTSMQHMSQSSFSFRPNLRLMNNYGPPSFQPINPGTNLFQSTYSIREIGSSSSSIVGLANDWNLSIYPSATLPQPSLLESNNDNNININGDENEVQTNNLWANYLQNNGYGEA